MKNQQKYDVKERPLNATEMGILTELSLKSGLNFKPLMVVMYERHTPRTTVCTIFLADGYDLFAQRIVGVTMRSRNDKEDPEIGRQWAFRRALEDYIERMQKK